MKLYDIRVALSFWCEDEELAELFAALLLQTMMFYWSGACEATPGVTRHKDEADSEHIPDTVEELIRKWRELDLRKREDSDGQVPDDDS